MSLFNQMLARPSSGRQQILSGMAFRLLSQVFSALPFFIAWWAINRAISQQTDSAFWWTLGGSLTACLLGQLICAWQGQLRCFLGSYALMRTLREESTNRLRLLPLGYFRQHRLGETSALLTDAMRRVEEIFSHLLPEVVVTLATALLFWLALAWVDLRLALALIATLPLAVLALWLMGRMLLRGTRQQGARIAQASGLLIEFISGLRTLRLFNRHHVMLQQIDETFADVRRASMGIEAWGGGGVQAFRLLVEVGLVALFLAAAQLFHTAGTDFSTWLLFVLVAYKVIDPLLDAAAFFTLLSVMRQSARKIEGLLTQPTQPEQGQQPLSDDNSLRVERVTFAYGQEEVLHEVSFKVPAGSVTALVGPSGSGKSTLLHLLGRFWTPQSGEIYLGGVPLSQLGSEQIFSRIGFVFQDVQLFDGSVLDNVRIGRPDASDAAVMAACRAACCEEFIQRLPAGYHTPLGEGAQRLSGGERQRLSIARMMLKDPAIIVLDEATALLDPLSQAQVQLALTRLAAGKTVVMVAHRLRTIEFADQILVVADGEIQQRGTHAQLLAEGGLYQRLWQSQHAGGARGF